MLVANHRIVMGQRMRLVSAWDAYAGFCRIMLTPFVPVATCPSTDGLPVGVVPRVMACAVPGTDGVVAGLVQVTPAVTTFVERFPMLPITRRSKRCPAAYSLSPGP